MKKIKKTSILFLLLFMQTYQPINSMGTEHLFKKYNYEFEGASAYIKSPILKENTPPTSPTQKISPRPASITLGKNKEKIPANFFPEDISKNTYKQPTQ